MTMIRHLIDKFIAKYSLGGLLETVEWESNGQTLSTTGTNQAQALVVRLTMELTGFPVGKFVIYNTSQFRSLLDVLHDDIKIDVQLRNNQPGAFIFSDKKSRIIASLADPRVDVIRPGLKPLPIPDIEGFIVEQEWSSSFIRAKGALGTEDFTLRSDGTKCELIQQDTGGNMVALEIPTTINNPIQPVTFESRYLQAILSANKDANHGKVAIYGGGLIHISYKETNFEVDYYLSKLVKY